MMFNRVRPRSDDLTMSKGWIAPAIWTLFVTIVLPTCATAVISGKSSVEKVLTAFTQPLFLLLFFSLVTALCLIRNGQRSLGWLLLLVSIFGWLSSTGVVVDRLLNHWESQIAGTPLDAMDPFDYVVVLGGGTSLSPDGRSQLSEAGDRVLFGAELYLKGYAKHLVTTGDALVMSGTLSGTRPPEDYPSAHTKKIWSKLNIPPEAVLTLGGENTSQELASLRERPEWWREKRCGLITSAFHMPRAMRLAKKVGVEVLPLNANYMGDLGPIVVEDFLPDAAKAYRIKLLVKEWSAAIVSR
jgi:uncharacterized SAM-binding protein YcdF (DUF218 family)